MNTTPHDVLADPLGVIVDLVGEMEPALDRAVIAAVVSGVAGGRAERRRLAQALSDQPMLLVEGALPGAAGGRGSAHRAAHRGCGEPLPAGLHRLRQAAAHPAPPRPGLVLPGLRSPTGNLLGLRPDQDGDLPRSARATPMRPVPT